jgi:hypothetical protein
MCAHALNNPDRENGRERQGEHYRQRNAPRATQSYGADRHRLALPNCNNGAKSAFRDLGHRPSGEGARGSSRVGASASTLDCVCHPGRGTGDSRPYRCCPRR